MNIIVVTLGFYNEIDKDVTLEFEGVINSRKFAYI